MFLLLREPTEGILSMHMASAWCCLKARTLLHQSCVLPRSLDDHIARSEGLRVPCLSGPESIWAFYREVGGSHWVRSPHHSVPVWPPGPGAWSQGRYLGRSTLDMQAWRPLQVQKSCRREDKAGVSPHTLSTPSICRCSIGSGQVRGCPTDLSPACCWLQYSHVRSQYLPSQIWYTEHNTFSYISDSISRLQFHYFVGLFICDC